MLVEWFENVGIEDVPKVGGKNASLGEMIRNMQAHEIRVPGGFAITADAYRAFVAANDIEGRIRTSLDDHKAGRLTLEDAGRQIRRLFVMAEFPDDLAQEIRKYYAELCKRHNVTDVDTAVRSSATAEDLPDASFAGQQETMLNIRGADEVLDATRLCFASLFTDRAIAYREAKGFDHMSVALSVGVQKMVRSDLAGSGVMFSIDTESGYPDAVLINAAWGIGETVVQGEVTPDEYRVFKKRIEETHLTPIIQKDLGAKEVKMVYASGGRKHTTRNIATTKKEQESFVLSNEEIVTLARWACRIEKHYGRPMDMEWAKDGETGEVFIVQARPETVHSQLESDSFTTFHLKERGPVLSEGLSVGDRIAVGKAKVLRTVEDMQQFEDGAILVTETTDPNWVPIMKRAAGIITDRGGRTSHAAIISRELGIPAIVGAERATETIPNGAEITLSCAEGDRGYVYEGRLAFEEETILLSDVPETKTVIKLNIASPSAAFRWWKLPAHGIGLARMEFIVSNVIKIHPMALMHFDRVKDESARRTIEEMTAGYRDRREYFVERLTLGIARITASQHPHPVILRMSDFKSNEYADLIGGRVFEPHEENPMIGFRGASRYYSEAYREGFALECRAVKRVREEVGLENLWVMVPFCRTLEEADRVISEMEWNGLKRGENGLKFYVMCEIPANVILAEEFADRFDGFSIGSNDLTQLTLGIDRDSTELAYMFDERNEAVKRFIKEAIDKAHRKGREIGICGQGPSDYPEFAEFLVEAGIDSISLNPDSVVETKKRIAALEKRLGIS